MRNLHVDELEFLANVTDRFDGWLMGVAAHLTLELLKSQRHFEVRSGMLEIGIYEGKSLSLILKEAVQSEAAVLAIETFQFFTEEHVRAKIKEYFPDLERFHIHHGKSSDLTADDVMKILDGKARFVSVDGSHMAADVEHDLHLAATVATDAGIVSADDFLNPMTLGVNEGIARFMISHGGRLSPFCYCGNKLFLCRPPFRAFFSGIAETFIRTNRSYPESKTFADMAAQWRGTVEVEYFGDKVLIIR
jgi:hypothetical protein